VNDIYLLRSIWIKVIFALSTLRPSTLTSAIVPRHLAEETKRRKRDASATIWSPPAAYCSRRRLVAVHLAGGTTEEQTHL